DAPTTIHIDCASVVGICWTRSTSIWKGGRIFLRGHVLAEVATDKRGEDALLQDDVHDTGDRVRPVLGGCSIAQNLYPVNGAGRDRVHVDAARTRAFTSAVIVRERRVMPSLAIQQHKRVIGAEPAHGKGSHDLGRIRHALAWEVDRGG